MKKKIYKYTLKMVDEQTVTLPYRAELLSIQNQNDEITFWALVDPSAEGDHYIFNIYGTGQDVPILSNNDNYFGTVQIGALVWHVFYRF